MSKGAATLFAALALVATVTGIVSAPAYAGYSQSGGSQVTLNPGGGILSDGTDGLRFTINSAAGSGSYNAGNIGQDGVVYRATRQYCCTAGAPMLNIGGTLYGQAGPAASAANWTSIETISTSGATSVGARTATTGTSGAALRYTAVQSGLTYTMDRTMSYTYPNDYVTDSYSFTIPDGNVAVVKFYLGGDTAPGSSDQGYGVMLTSPVRTVISLNTASHIMFGFREVSGSKVFDGATSQQYNTPFPTVTSGGNIGFVGTASNHDAGLMMQWNLGSTPGTQTASLEQFASQQGTNLNASFAASSALPGSPVQLNVSIVNTVLSTVTGLDYTASLPAGLVIGSGSVSNTCGGTFTAAAGSSSIVLAGGAVNSTSNCVMSVPVVSATAASYTMSAGRFSGLAVLTNNVGTSTLVFTNDSDHDGINDDAEDAAPNAGDANNDGTADKTQLNVTSFSNPISGAYTALSADSSCELTSINAVAAASQATRDNSYRYPMGLLDFTANCGTPGFTSTITQYYYDPPSHNFVLRKLVAGNYQTVSGATFSTVTIAGHQVLKVSYQVTDGGALDDDGSANGVIVDPAGPAVLGATTLATSPAATVSAPDTGLADENIFIPIGAMLIGAGLVLSGMPAVRRFVAHRFKQQS